MSERNRPHNFGGGFEGKVDRIPVGGGNVEHEVHVYRKGEEVGVFRDGRFVGKHGFQPDVWPEGFTQENFNKLKGLDVNLARAEGRLGPKGTVNIQGNAYGGLIRGLGPLMLLDTLIQGIGMHREIQQLRQCPSQPIAPCI